MSTLNWFKRSGWKTLFAFTIMATSLCITSAFAQEEAPPPPPTVEDVLTKLADSQMVANTVWTLIAGMLVFFMNAGFGMLETGLCRRKNAVHILAKNFIVFAVSSIAFWMVGFGLMFGGTKTGEEIAGGGFIGMTGFFPTLIGDDALFPGISWAVVPVSVKFFFQLVFAGTAATIVSGACAERMKFSSFMLFSFLLVAFVYPLTGHWIWGSGWIASLATPFHDFAGSTVVHSVGGWAALAGVVLLGPRLGKYSKDGKVNPIPGHNMGLAALGCLILWLGWFGFNPGSTMGAVEGIGYIAVTTNTAAAFGAVAATITAWLVLGKPDLSMILNGCLAGLVAITAPCAVVTVGGAAIIGLIAGALVVFSVLAWDKLKIDDPVGALSVHLVCGIWGTLAVGLFAAPAALDLALGVSAPGLFYGGNAAQLWSQIIGIGAVGGTVFVLSLIVWGILKATVGIRVSEREEVEGLDIGEHGMEAYPGFAVEAMGEIQGGGSGEPRASISPPNGKKRYAVVIEGADGGQLMEAWTGLCHASSTPTPEFKAVYPYFSTVSGNKFRFLGGDPGSVSQNISKLFQGVLGNKSIKAKVEA